jgi:hypothetical protein
MGSTNGRILVPSDVTGASVWVVDAVDVVEELTVGAALFDGVGLAKDEAVLPVGLL